MRRRVDDLDRGRALDHVVVRQHLAGPREDHSRAGGDAVLIPERRVDVDDAGVDCRESVVDVHLE